MGDIARLPKPDWLKKRIPSGQACTEVSSLLRDRQLHTVCQEAHCPNLGECFSRGTATFMILGDRCTRNCNFCAVHHDFVPLFVCEAQGSGDLWIMCIQTLGKDLQQDWHTQEWAGHFQQRQPFGVMAGNRHRLIRLRALLGPRRSRRPETVLAAGY